MSMNQKFQVYFLDVSQGLREEAQRSQALPLKGYLHKPAFVEQLAWPQAWSTSTPRRFHLPSEHQGRRRCHRNRHTSLACFLSEAAASVIWVYLSPSISSPLWLVPVVDQNSSDGLWKQMVCQPSEPLIYFPFHEWQRQLHLWQTSSTGPRAFLKAFLELPESQKVSRCGCKNV